MRDSDDKPWQGEEEIIKHGIIAMVHGWLSFAAWLPGGPGSLAQKGNREHAIFNFSLFGTIGP